MAVPRRAPTPRLNPLQEPGFREKPGFFRSPAGDLFLDTASSAEPLPSA